MCLSPILKPRCISDCMLLNATGKRHKPDVVVDHDEEDKTKTGNKDETNPEDKNGDKGEKGQVAPKGIEH